MTPIKKPDGWERRDVPPPETAVERAMNAHEAATADPTKQNEYRNAVNDLENEATLISKHARALEDLAKAKARFAEALEAGAD